MIENGRTLEWLLRMCQLKKVVMLKAKSRFVNPNVHAKVFFEPTKENSKQTVFWPVLNTCCSLCKFLPILEHYSSLLDITQIFIRVLKLSRIQPRGSPPSYFGNSIFVCERREVSRCHQVLSTSPFSGALAFFLLL
nr:uncharacterized protein LOC104085844 isoform X2 [Nicotiana tomentosiformis]